MNKTIAVGKLPKGNAFVGFIHKRRSLLIDIISSLLILLFIYASVSKFITFQKFIGEMNSQPFPNWMTPYLVWGIPLIEIAISLCLMFDETRLVALYASFVLMSLFSVYIGAILLNFFERVPCSCGGVLKQLGWKSHFFFNLFFVLLSFLGIHLQRSKLKGSA